MSLSLVQNLIGVTAYSDQRLLDVSRNTIAFKDAALDKAKATVEEQAKELAILQVRLQQIEAEKQQLVLVHKTEVNELTTTNANLSYRVKYLEGDVQDRQKLLDVYNKKLHEAKYVMGNLCKRHDHSDVGLRNWSDAHRVANS